MKLQPKHVAPAVLALFAGAAGLAATQTPQQPSPSQRIEALERQVATLQSEMTKLQQRLGPQSRGLSMQDTATAIESLVHYAEAQARSAESLERTLAECKDLGFVPGINWKSREALLKGMNEFVGTLQRQVPKLPVKGRDGTLPR